MCEPSLPQRRIRAANFLAESASVGGVAGALPARRAPEFFRAGSRTDRRGGADGVVAAARRGNPGFCDGLPESKLVAEKHSVADIDASSAAARGAVFAGRDGGQRIGGDLTMPRPSLKSGAVAQLYSLLDDIDRAGYTRGTASRLDWLRIKARAGRSRAGLYARTLYALLAEIHRLGLMAGTDAHARWQMLKEEMKHEATAVAERPLARCHATFLFWRGRQLDRAGQIAAGCGAR